MSTQQRYCLAPRALKKFIFPVSNISNVEKPDCIMLKPSIYRKVKKMKKLETVTKRIKMHAIYEDLSISNNNNNNNNNNKYQQIDTNPYDIMNVNNTDSPKQPLPYFVKRGLSLKNIYDGNKLNKESHLTHLSNLTEIKKSKKSKQTKTSKKSKKIKKNKSMTFHFVGIRPNESNKKHKTTLEFDGIDIDSVVTVKFPLKTSDTVCKLKKYIRKTFNIPSYHNILILYSHLVISNDNHSKLNEFGITNQSLLILAICDEINIFDNVKTKYMFNNEHKIDSENKISAPAIDQLDIECIKGFDVITQQNDIDVYRMPKCHHLMSKESLYHYALSQFNDKNNIHLTCPHIAEIKEDEKYDNNEWSCNKCTFLNDEDTNKCSMCDTYKQWNCSRCTILNDGKYKKCQMCRYNKPAPNHQAVDPKDLLCGEIWDYSLIKQILTTNTVSYDMLNDERHKLMNRYYDVRYKYSNLKQKNKAISNEFQREIRNIQKRLINEFNMNDKTDLIKIRKKAKKDVKNDSFHYPKHDEINNDKYIYESTAKLELLSARNNIQNKYDLQKCPKCNTLYYKKNKVKKDEMKDFETECILCTDDKSFCWICGKEWINGHLCDSRFRLQLIEILKNAKTKKIGYVDKVPSIRCCPKCSQLIYHTAACKHMECTGCKTKFCFVCMKLYKNGSWQCGSSSSRCPIAPRQNMKTLPNTVDINQQTFHLF